tara:strand:- start:89 stop:289 length:201 start_codon:yes stop_codon:yes gene_type:complete
MKVNEIYIHEEDNPKRITNDLSVSFYFNDDVTLEEADGYITSLLQGIDNNVEYSFDMWSIKKDDSE